MITWALPLPFSSRMTWPIRTLRFFLRVLVVVGAVLVDGRRVRGEHPVDDRAELARVAHLREAALLDDLRGHLSSAIDSASTSLAWPREIVPVGDQADELGEHLRREHRGRQARIVQVAEHVLAHPVGDVLRRAAAFSAATARSA